MFKTLALQMFSQKGNALDTLTTLTALNMTFVWLQENSTSVNFDLLFGGMCNSLARALKI